MTEKSEKCDKHYFQAFRDVYAKEFSFILKSVKGNKYAFCSVCRCEINISHGGKNDILKHAKSQKHVSSLKCRESSAKINKFFVSSSTSHSAIRAECLFTSFLVEHNLPISVADHAGPLFRKMFPKSEEAKKYACGRTKTTAIVEEMAMQTREGIVHHLQSGPFSLATDGSNDTDAKLYPIVVTFFDTQVKNIVSCVLSLPALQGDSTGRNIGGLMLSELERLKVPVTHMISFSADNAAVMLGNKNGVAAVLKQKQEHLIVMGCLCHLINLAAEKGTICLPLRVEDVLVDIYYYLERSAKRKESLKKFQDLHSQEPKKILKHVCTRWLSLGRCLQRLVEQWEPLLGFFEAQQNVVKSQTSTLSSFKIPKQTDRPVQVESSVCKKKSIFLKSKNPVSFDKFATQKVQVEEKLPNKSVETSKAGDKRKLAVDTTASCSSKNSASKNCAKKFAVDRPTVTTNISREEFLYGFLSSSVNKAFCLFLLHVIPTFERLNTVLQSSVPQIHTLRQQLFEFLKEILSKFVKPTVIKQSSLLDVRYHLAENQRSDVDLSIGNETQNVVSTLKEAEKNFFFSSVRKYFVCAVDYIINKFPLKNDVLKKASVASIDHIEHASFVDVKYFVELFPFLLSVGDDESVVKAMDDLQSQFNLLQLEDISSLVAKEDTIVEKWVKVSNITSVDGKPKFGRLAKVMLSILTIPHSNAECERVFSLVRKTRTQFRSQMSNRVLENTSIIKCRALGNCYEQEFTEAFLLKAKKATVASLKKCEPLNLTLS